MPHARHGPAALIWLVLHCLYIPSSYLFVLSTCLSRPSRPRRYTHTHMHPTTYTYQKYRDIFTLDIRSFGHFHHRFASFSVNAVRVYHICFFVFHLCVVCYYILLLLYTFIYWILYIYTYIGDESTVFIRWPWSYCLRLIVYLSPVPQPPKTPNPFVLISSSRPKTKQPPPPYKTQHPPVLAMFSYRSKKTWFFRYIAAYDVSSRRFPTVVINGKIYTCFLLFSQYTVRFCIPRCFGQLFGVVSCYGRI